MNLSTANIPKEIYNLEKIILNEIFTPAPFDELELTLWRNFIPLVSCIHSRNV